MACRPASLKSRVVALPVFWPLRTVTLAVRSYCTRFTVMDEFAHRVPERSPPEKLTSTASALAMVMILSVQPLTCSRVYMRRSLPFLSSAPPQPPFAAEQERERYYPRRRSHWMSPLIAPARLNG